MLQINDLFLHFTFCVLIIIIFSQTVIVRDIHGDTYLDFVYFKKGVRKNLSNLILSPYSSILNH